MATIAEQVLDELQGVPTGIFSLEEAVRFAAIAVVGSNTTATTIAADAALTNIKWVLQEREELESYELSDLRWDGSPVVQQIVNWARNPLIPAANAVG